MIRILFFLVLIPMITQTKAMSDKDIGSPTVYCRVTFTEAAVAGINTIYIPFTLAGRLMIVQASVDQQAGNFIVDTGSERLLLNKDYFSAFASGDAVTALGNTGFLTADQVTVDSLHLDRLSLTHLNAHIVDLDHIELKKNTRIHGILGYHVFKNFEVFIDFQNSRIVLSKVDRKGQRLDTKDYFELPYDSLSFELQKHFIVLKAVVNGVCLDMILDSGAELNLIDRRVGKRVLENFSIIKRVNLIGMGKRQVEVLAGKLADVRCGRQHAESMNTLFTSLDEINTNFGLRVDGVLGYEFLQPRRTLINYQKRKLYFFGPQRS